MVGEADRFDQLAELGRRVQANTLGGEDEGAGGEVDLGAGLGLGDVLDQVRGLAAGVAAKA
jgi:hypothetical protein